METQQSCVRLQTSQETLSLFDSFASIQSFETFLAFQRFQTVLVNYKILTMAFTHCVQLRLNRVGGIYDNGRRLSQLLRERVLDLHHDEMSPQMIANEVKSSRHFVRNVLRDYDQNNSSMPKMRETQP